MNQFHQLIGHTSALRCYRQFLIGVLRQIKRVFSKEAFKRGRIKGAGQDGSQEWITVLASICMDGTWIPPALIYQAVSGDIQDTWATEVDPMEH